MSSKKEYQRRGGYHVFNVSGGMTKPIIPPNPPHPDDFMDLNLNNDEQLINIQKDKLTLDTEILSHNSKTTRLAIKNKRTPRPQNAFIIYRRDQKARLKKLPEYKGKRESELSRVIADNWVNESEEAKNMYRALSNLAKKNHRDKYKDYVYKPRKSKNKQEELPVHSVNSDSSDIQTVSSESDAELQPDILPTETEQNTSNTPPSSYHAFNNVFLAYYLN